MRRGKGQVSAYICKGLDTLLDQLVCHRLSIVCQPLGTRLQCALCEVLGARHSLVMNLLSSRLDLALCQLVCCGLGILGNLVCCWEQLLIVEPAVGLALAATLSAAGLS